MTPDPAELLDVACSVARQAAELVRQHRSHGVTVADTKSSSVDVVTEADRASERLIRSLVLEARPDDSILGEEGDDHVGTSPVRWVVDPIDGTVNYLYGIPEYAVSMAAEVDGRVVAGVVHNVATGVEYAAVLGGGATRDGVPLRVRDVPPVQQRLVLTGFGYDREVRAGQAERVARLLPRVRDVRRMGSCALDLCHVAEGAADGYVEEGPHPWDWSAGALVAAEAGATFALLPGSLVAPCEGQPGSVVAAAPAAGWDEFTALLADCGFVIEPRE
ncbi:inositol monophosphatase family protein [Nocardioides coralli]|uniref:inositol monophosphatase family protein n=1 Tax=Nocardioides coralli TaxID=2872154 RepID=UPI001CA45B0C|nr:inositol monophosphatase family protein [Nocardioides coralli]QZY27846.1 inositol monophosphatase [Nocardioides coralli]